MFHWRLLLQVIISHHMQWVPPSEVTVVFLNWWHWGPPPCNGNCPLPSLTSKWTFRYCWWPVAWGLILNYNANKNSTTNSTLVVTLDCNKDCWRPNTLQLRNKQYYNCTWMKLRTRLWCIMEVGKSSQEGCCNQAWLITNRKAISTPPAY